MTKNQELKINIKENEGQLVVSSREVAENFSKENKTVNRDIRNLMAQNCTVKNLFMETSYISSRGRKEKEYLMTRDGFTLLAMGFTGKKALEWKLKYIEAFNEMEEYYKNRHEQDYKEKFQLPKTYKEALICLVKAEDEKERLQEKIDVLEPKADYTDKVLNSNGLITINTIAKDYDYTAQEMNQTLHELGIQYKQGKRWFLYKKYCGNGYVFSNTKLKEANNESEVITHWTQKGKAFLYKILKINGIVPITEKNSKKIKRIV